MPCDGRNVDGSAWRTLIGIPTVYDLRGKFVRGSNLGASGAEFDESSRNPGSYQEDAFKSHKHNVRGYASGVAGSYDGSSEAISHVHYSPDGTDNRIVVSTAGGSETRPKNVAVAWFCRIN